MSDCCCNNGNGFTTIYACSGSANTGYLSDLIARRLDKEGLGNNSCLMAIGADLSGFIESAKASTLNIVIDGCATSCGKTILDNKNIPCTQFVITDEKGIRKYRTKITDAIIEEVYQNIKEKIVKKQKIEVNTK